MESGTNTQQKLMRILVALLGVAFLCLLFSDVALAEDVTGPYDVIARLEAETVDELGKLVIARIQEVPGITRTLTCPVVPTTR